MFKLIERLFKILKFKQQSIFQKNFPKKKINQRIHHIKNFQIDKLQRILAGLIWQVMIRNDLF